MATDLMGIDLRITDLMATDLGPWPTRAGRCHNHFHFLKRKYRVTLALTMSVIAAKYPQ